jgi:hypothetical protein
MASWLAGKPPPERIRNEQISGWQLHRESKTLHVLLQIGDFDLHVSR